MSDLTAIDILINSDETMLAQAKPESIEWLGG
jgi:hypothetical protein